MKITSTYLILLPLLAIAATSCQHERRQMEQAALAYSVAAANYDLATAAEYCTAETQQTTLTFAKRLLEMVDSSFIPTHTPATVEITRVHLTSDTVGVVHYHKVTPQQEYRDTLELRRRNGQWLAHSPMQTRHTEKK